MICEIIYKWSLLLLLFGQFKLAYLYFAGISFDRASSVFHRMQTGQNHFCRRRHQKCSSSRWCRCRNCIVLTSSSSDHRSQTTDHRLSMTCSRDPTNPGCLYSISSRAFRIHEASRRHLRKPAPAAAADDQRSDYLLNYRPHHT